MLSAQVKPIEDAIFRIKLRSSKVGNIEQNYWQRPLQITLSVRQLDRQLAR